MTWGIVVAGGSGSRFGRPKHLVELEGVPLWQRAKAVLEEAGCAGVVVVGDVPGGVEGGPRRSDSVAAGLTAVPESEDWILVHDAARPLASVDLVTRVVERLLLGDVDAVVPVISPVDTLKLLEGESVVETADRASFGVAQTPQGFRAGTLRRVHATDRGEATDDAALVERNGGRVVAVKGEASNIKVTVPADLLMARALL